MGEYKQIIRVDLTHLAFVLVYYQVGSGCKGRKHVS